MAMRKKARKRDEALAGIDDGCESWLVEGVGMGVFGTIAPAAGAPDGQR